MARKNVVSSKPVKGQDGKKAGTLLTFEDDTKRILLNPHGKGRKYATELREGKRLTNSGEIKVDRKGRLRRLSDTAKAYRSGYLQAQKDSAKAYNAKK